LAAAVPCVGILFAVSKKLLPIVRWKPVKHSNAFNSQLYIQVDPKVPCPKAVLAQELYECLYKINPIKVIYSKTGKGARELETMSHEVEVQAAVELYGVDEAGYRRKEAVGMAAFYPFFKGFSADTLVEQMERKTPQAKAWLKRNRNKL
jgi:hypothetical protein